MRNQVFAVAAALAIVLGVTAAAGSTTVSYPTVAYLDGTPAASLDTSGLTAEVPAPLELDSLVIEPEAVEPLVIPASTPAGNNKQTTWGYEAALTSRVHSWLIGPTGTGPVTPTGNCVPGPPVPPVSNGRGVAFDPLSSNILITRLTGFGVPGDNQVFEIVPPNVSPGVCPVVRVVTVTDTQGDFAPRAFGSIDVDEATKHWWLAEYQPIVVGGVPLSFFYKVNRNTGEILDGCAIRFRGGGVGNETLAVFRDPDLPGSDKYLLTDAGEPNTVPNTYAVIDQADCHRGEVVTPVAEFPKTNPGGAAGIDFEWPGLIVSNLFQFWNVGDDPFTTPIFMGSTAPGFNIEDISVCGFRGSTNLDPNDGGGNDFCPYP